MTPSPEAPPAEGAVPASRAGLVGGLRAAHVASLLCAAAAAGDLVAFQQRVAHGLAGALPFLLAAVVQLVVARQVWVSRGTAAALCGVLVLGLLIGTYVVAVSTGVTPGPQNRPVEADPLLTAALCARLAALLVLLRSLSGRARSRAVNALLVIGTVLWTLGLTGLLG
ncbi:hypothetical protein ACH4ND_06945 [Streptomyces sp. NPDC017179]|uniref:hypothetical protein n=1 Tax=Streptomyces sp. NPDC017179 TaxID=3364979 RepID=UPI0037B20059